MTIRNTKTEIRILKKGIKCFTEHNKIDFARGILEGRINSDEFKRAVKNHEYLGKKTFIQNNGLTNDEILTRLLEGSEILNKKIDFVWNIQLTIIDRPWYKRYSTVNGFTYPNTLEIKIYRDSFNQMSIEYLAGFIGHEQCHNLGFEHDFRATMRRPFSVPYAVGGIIVAMGENDV